VTGVQPCALPISDYDLVRDCDSDYGPGYDHVRDCDSDYGSGYDHVAARGQPHDRTMRPALGPVAVESRASVNETEFVTAT
jgi:hypothetical protein